MKRKENIIIAGLLVILFLLNPANSFWNRRELQVVDGVPIQITYTLDNQFQQFEVKPVYEKIIITAISIIQNIIKVFPRVKPIKLDRLRPSCSGLQFTPSDFLSQDINDSDLHLYIDFLQSPEIFFDRRRRNLETTANTSNGPLGDTNHEYQICQLQDDNKGVEFGYFQIKQSELLPNTWRKNFDDLDNELFVDAVNEVLHTLMRFLGFSDELKDLWINQDKSLPYTPLSEFLTPELLMTPTVQMAYSMHFGCSDPAKAFLKLDTGQQDLFLHLDSAGNCITTVGGSNFQRTLGIFDVAILNDIGWYADVQYEFLLTSMTWGRNLGCDFVGSCKTTQLNENEFCNFKFSQVNGSGYTDLGACDSNHKSKIQCTRSNDQECFNNLADSYSKTSCSKNTDFNHFQTDGFYSRCFYSNIYQYNADRRSNSFIRNEVCDDIHETRCFESECIQNQFGKWEVYIYIDETYICQHPGDQIPTNKLNFNGYVNCPNDFQTFCSDFDDETMPPMFEINQMYLTINHQKICMGWATGEDCNRPCYGYIHANSCVSQCPIGYLPDKDNMCRYGCHPSCSECDFHWEGCTYCDEGINRLDYSANYHCRCELGYYDIGNYACKKICHTACSECTGPTIEECTVCNTKRGYIMNTSTNRCQCEQLPSNECFVINMCSNPTGCSWIFGNNFLDSNDKTIYKCHYSCYNGCTGSTNFDCLDCPTSPDAWFNRQQPQLPSRRNLFGGTTQCNCITDTYDIGETRCTYLQVCDVNCKICNQGEGYYCTQCYPMPRLNRSIMSCTDCIQGYYYNSNQNSCLRCHPSCAKCNGASQFNCDSCYDGYSLHEEFDFCFYDPPKGLYYDTSNATFKACHASCLTCAGPLETDCLSCTEFCGFPSEGDYRCVDTGSSGIPVCCGKLSQDDLNNCSLCADPRCQTCSQMTGCLNDQCYPPFVQTGKDPIFGLFAICDCSFGFYLDSNDRNNHCQPCDPRCDSCVGPTNNDCLQCKTISVGRNLESRQLQKSITCDCPSGQFYNSLNKQCLGCNWGCSSCTEPYSKCLSCEEGFIKQLDNCVQSCDSGFYHDDKINECTPCQVESCTECNADPIGTLCQTCNELFFYDGSVNKCLKCAPCCQTCTGITASDCLSCRDINQFIFQGMCLSDCPIGLFLVNGEGGKTCQPCATNCQYCSGALTTECYTCMETYYLAPSFDCLPCGIDGCLVCFEYYLDAQAFQMHCKTCQTPQLRLADKTCGGTLTECPDGQFLDGEHVGKCKYCSNTKCVQCDPVDYGATCICDPNYLWDADLGECLFDQSLCDPSCANCDGILNTNCTACGQGLYLKLNTCVTDCGVGFFLDTTYNICTECISFCDICTGPNGADCSQCSTGYYFDSTNSVCSACSIDFCIECAEITLPASVTPAPSPVVPLALRNLAFASVGAIQKSCILCQPGYLALPTGDCSNLVTDCPNASYKSPDYTAVCLYCSNQDCKTCDPIDNGNTCTCPIKDYLWDSTNKVCTFDQSLCFAACQQCTGPNSNQCALCTDPSFKIQNGECVATCNPNTFERVVDVQIFCDQCAINCDTCTGGNPADCTKCSKTFFFNQANLVCQPCGIALCDECALDQPSSTIKCIVCNNSYLILSDATVCDNKIVSCPAHTYEDPLKSQVCIDCSNPDCISCNPADKGLTCVCAQKNFVWNSTKKVCQFNQALCNQDCSSCVGQTASDCLTCQDSLKFLKSGSCVLSCGAGFFADSSMTCKSCTKNCSVCTGPSNPECSVCLDTFYKMIPSDYCNPCGITDCVGCTEKYNPRAQANQVSCEVCLFEMLALPNGSCSPSVTVCPEGSFQLQKNTSRYCQYCNSEFCISCNSNDKGVTCTQCQDLYFFNVNSLLCERCHTDCAVCTGQTNSDCTQCVDPLFFLQAGQCVNQCSDNFYQVGSTLQCLPCAPNCQTCSGPSELECSACISGFVKEPNSGTPCQSCGLENCLECVYQGNVKVCSVCQPGFMIESLAAPFCVVDDGNNCPRECLTCYPDNLNFCSSCQDPQLVLFEGRCVSVCPQTYYLDQPTNSFLRCAAKCKSCEGPNFEDCKQCIDGYYRHPSSLQCLSCDINNCAHCSIRSLPPTYEEKISCTECLFGLVLPTGNCSLKGNSITSCPSGSFLNPDNSLICDPCSVPSCSICDALNQGQICKQCVPNFKLTNSICVSQSMCHQSCQTCTDTTDAGCLTCLSDQDILTKGRCTISCPEIGFFLQQTPVKSCVACQKYCLKCSNLTSECQQCQEGYLPDPSNPGACFLQPCNVPFCELCELGVCKKCVVNRRIFLSGDCLEYCPTGFFNNIPTNECLKCQPNCLDCISIVECKVCNDETYLQQNTKSCIPFTVNENQTQNQLTMTEIIDGKDNKDPPLSVKKIGCHYSCIYCIDQTLSGCVSCPITRSLEQIPFKNFGQCYCDDGLVDVMKEVCEQREQIESISNASDGFLVTSITLSLIAGLAGGNPFIILGMLDTCQTLSHMIYINKDNLLKVDSTNQRLYFSHFSSIPKQPTEVADAPKSSNTRNVEEKQEPPTPVQSSARVLLDSNIQLDTPANLRIEQNGKHSYFIINSLYTILFNAIAWIMAVVCHQSLQDKVKHQKLSKLRDFFSYSFAHFVYIFTISEFTLLIMYQYQLGFIDTNMNQICIAIASLCFLYILTVFGILFKRLIVDQIKEKTYQESRFYIFLFALFQRETLGQKLTPFVWVIRKILYSIILVHSFQEPVKQITLLFITYFAYWLYLIIVRPLQRSFDSTMIILVQLEILILHLIWILYNSCSIDDAECNLKYSEYVIIMTLVIFITYFIYGIIYIIYILYQLIQKCIAKNKKETYLQNTPDLQLNNLENSELITPKQPLSYIIFQNREDRNEIPAIETLNQNLNINHKIEKLNSSNKKIEISSKFPSVDVEMQSNSGFGSAGEHQGDQRESELSDGCQLHQSIQSNRIELDDLKNIKEPMFDE